MVLAWTNDLLNFLATVGDDIEPLKVVLVFMNEAEVNSRIVECAFRMTEIECSNKDIYWQTQNGMVRGNRKVKCRQL